MSPQQTSTTPGAQSVPAAPVDPRLLLIRASAGTGKTFQLTNRFISLLRHSSPERILAVTFTRKAAGEILERLLVRLAQAVADPREAEKLSEFTGSPPLTQPECGELLIKLTRQLHRVRIGTLDGFFSRLATVFAFELGFPAGWQIADESTLSRLQGSAIQNLLKSGDHKRLLQLVHMIDAGRLANGVHNLISNCVTEFHQICQQTPAAAWQRFPEYQYLTVETRERLIADLLAMEFPNKQMTNARQTDMEKFAREDWKEALSAGLFQKIISGDPTYFRKPIPAEAVAIYQQLIQHLRAATLNPCAVQTRATRDLLEDYDQCLQQLKQETHQLGFSDVTLGLSRSFGELQKRNLHYRLDSSIDHILVDEFQDTSPSQWSILKPLAKLAAVQTHRSFFCVGDPKQAIYGWRGGRAELFDALKDDLPGLTERQLQRSFRSSQVVMEAVNLACQNWAQHRGFENLNPALTRWSRAFPLHSTSKPELPGYVELRTGPAPDQDENDGIPGMAADFVAQQVTRTPQHTIGILARTNTAVATMMAELSRRGVEASEEGGTLVTDSAAVQLIMSLMQFIDHPGDTVARFHITHSPLAPRTGLSPEITTEQVLDIAARLRRQLVQDGYGKTVLSCAQILEPYCTERELKRLRQLCQFADSYDALATLRTRDFVHDLGQYKVYEPTQARVRVMTINQSKGLEFDIVVLPELDSTIKTSPKFSTLETDVQSPPEVVVLHQGEFIRAIMPDYLRAAYQQTQERCLNDAICVLYVAMTRAIHALHMFVKPHSGKTYGKSPAGLLRAGLAPQLDAPPNSTLFQMGDPAWFEKLASEQTKAGCDPAPQLQSEQPFSIKLAEISPARQRHMSRSTPSGLEGSRLVKLAGFLDHGSESARDRGTLFHRWFEQIKWLDEGVPPAEKLRPLGLDAGFSEAETDRLWGEFRKILAQPQVIQNLSREFYRSGSIPNLAPHVRAELQQGSFELEVLRERRFSLHVGETLLSGSLDRLVLMTRNWQVIAADIIDFKTDAAIQNPRILEEKKEYYRGQLTSYITAVGQLYELPSDRISARLLMVGMDAATVIPI